MDVLDDLGGQIARLPDKVRDLIMLRARKDLFDVSVEDLFETYFEKQLTPLGRTVLDGAIADRLCSRRGDFPFNGRSPEEAREILMDSRHPEHESLYQEDTLTVLLRLAALTVPGSALDEEIRGHISRVLCLSHYVGWGEPGDKVLLCHDPALRMLGCLCVDDGSHLRAYAADLNKLLARTRQPYDAERLKGTRLCFVYKYSRTFRDCPEIKKMLALSGHWSSGRLAGALVSAHLPWIPEAEARDITEMLAVEIQLELDTVAEKLAAVPAPDVLAHRQRKHALFLRGCFPLCERWMATIMFYSVGLQDEWDLVGVGGGNWERAAAAFLQAAAVEPDDDLATRILRWVETYHSRVAWFPPPVVLPARAAELDRIRRLIMRED